ncbi:MAG: indole-3-glycerol phosphate synthase TrpC [Firmicutes bacterium]|nr:indole-3-glycerol phosphate synthase TrpC [Bacillota bacterium]
MKQDILTKIIAHKKTEVEQNQRRLPLAEIKERLTETPPAGDFAAALCRPGEVALIAEVKRRSPSRGLIRRDFNLAEIVAAYHEGGADAISVLTDSEFFGGAPEFLAAARQITTRPLLRKDFILSRYQVYESRLLGADAVLLIAGVLEDGEMAELIGLSRRLGMEALVETRTPEEISRARAAGAKIIGVNNRDLRNFQVDINTTVQLIEHISDPGVTVVSESGIKSRADVRMLGARGVRAVLVGETLMAAGDLRAGIRRLKGLEARRAVTGA